MRCWYGSGWNGRFEDTFGAWTLLMWTFNSCWERKDWPQWVHWGGCRATCRFTLCAASVWHIKPWFDTNLSSHWSHLEDSNSASIAENGTDVWEMTGGRWIGFGASTIEVSSTFLFRNFSLLAAFRLRVEGLDFFFFFGKDAVSLESKEKVKVEPTVTEKEKALPWPARVWQRAKHWDAKDKSSSEALGADIFCRISELIKLLEQETHVASSTRSLRFVKNCQHCKKLSTL